MSYQKRFLLLGSGELGREFVIAVKRLGCYIVAIGRYENAPAMQMADDCEVIDMFNGDELDRVVKKYKPDFIVPEIEAINIDKLFEFESRGICVVPSANAVKISMDRKGLRLLATQLGLKTVEYRFANSYKTLKNAIDHIGIPCVVKPLMSSSGKGQTIIKTQDDIDIAWNNLSKSRGSKNTEMIIEKFLSFDYEITVLTVSQHNKDIVFCPPIGHKQEKGDYQESWQPHPMEEAVIRKAEVMAEKIVKEMGGVGVWGAEFFVKDNNVYFSEISPRPHDTGMVTLTGTQYLNEFELHTRAIMGLYIPCDKNNRVLTTKTKGVSRAICCNTFSSAYGDQTSKDYTIDKVESSLEIDNQKKYKTDVRLFSKPVGWEGRRIGVVLVGGEGDENISRMRKHASSMRDLIKINFNRGEKSERLISRSSMQLALQVP
jgi:phosphoribosylglycinamide formyltransferase 2